MGNFGLSFSDIYKRVGKTRPKLFCRLFGHKIYAKINEMGQEFDGFMVWSGELICSRCDRRVEFIHKIEINKRKK